MTRQFALLILSMHVVATIGARISSKALAQRRAAAAAAAATASAASSETYQTDPVSSDSQDGFFEKLRVEEQMKVTERLENYRKGPVRYIKYRKGDVFLCVRKWELRKGAFTGQYCLAKAQDAIHAMNGIKKFKHGKTETNGIKLAKSISHCVAKSMTYRIKNCNFKITEGQPDTARLSYVEKVYLPKSCFALLEKEPLTTMTGQSVGVDTLQAAVSPKECIRMLSSKEAAQDKYSPGLPKPTAEAAEKTANPNDPKEEEMNVEDQGNDLKAAADDAADDVEETVVDGGVALEEVTDFAAVRAFWEGGAKGSE